ncbi:hypothetical protein [Anaeromyxobacter oryzae]|uniref:Uncharacterized protein n=1 Tax=Anaeromyxobacter oryzae TaxID=2918170 RepID=A0ABN6MYF2_9BACT|nr:hypothetical protein [Anaeromyxobacter oryzae]BDG05994.1 hypothetical protein AMOR_49900 [Anaeromyxobacter oryzae]
MTIVQVWFVFGSYLWGEMLLGFPALKREAILALGAVLLVANYVVLRRRGWEEFEKRFALCSARSRLGWLAVAGTASVAAFSVFLGAGTAARSGR